MNILNLIIGVGFLLLAAVLLSLAIGTAQFFWKRSRVHEAVAGMESGIYVRHGMEIDPETGLVSSHKSPSQEAYHRL